MSIDSIIVFVANLHVSVPVFFLFTVPTQCNRINTKVFLASFRHMVNLTNAILLLTLTIFLPDLTLYMGKTSGVL